MGAFLCFIYSFTISSGNIVNEDEDKQVNQCQPYFHVWVIIQFFQYSGHMLAICHYT